MKISTMVRPADLKDLDDYGVAPGRLEGDLPSSGKVLHGGLDEPNHCGLWVCGTGKFECTLDKDEFFYFLAGRATYVHEDGETVEITPDMAAFFPKGWSGTCTVHEEMKSVYMVP